MLDRTRKTLSAMTGSETFPPSLVAMVDSVEKKKHTRESGPLSIEMLALLLVQHEGCAEPTAAKKSHTAPAKPAVKTEPEYNGKWADVAKGTKIEVEGEDGLKIGQYLCRMSKGPQEGRIRVKVDGDEAPFRTVDADCVSVV